MTAYFGLAQLRLPLTPVVLHTTPTGLEGHDIEKTIAARYGLGKDELEGNKEALMRRVNYKQHASKASRIFQSGPAWVG